MSERPTTMATEKSSHIRMAHVPCIHLYIVTITLLYAYTCRLLCIQNHETKPFIELIKMKCISCVYSVLCSLYCTRIWNTFCHRVYRKRCVEAGRSTINANEQMILFNCITFFNFKMYGKK